MRPLKTLFRRSKSAKPKVVRRSGRASKGVRRIAGSFLGAAILLALIAAGGTVFWFRSTIERWANGLTTETTRRIDVGIVRAGLTIADVRIEGLAKADPEAVRAALDARVGASIFGFDPSAARNRLVALGWIKEAQVIRQLPNLIVVSVEERAPYALWQVAHDLKLIGRDGVVITTEHLGRYRDLPLVVGPGAAQEAATVIALVATQPELFRRMRAATWVSERRWDLRFDSGVDVRLPADNPEQAIARLAALDRAHGILDRKLKAIDLRLPDRLIVQSLEPTATRASGVAAKDS
ncbi:MAG: FtsQ-type POTRA domain-containing protein [Alphaproteobacteria bacterium]|nr:FtsQ-type POTRA domain-containing protein [Alphaproteobacteria bacterium]